MYGLKTGWMAKRINIWMHEWMDELVNARVAG